MQYSSSFCDSQVEAAYAEFKIALSRKRDTFYLAMLKLEEGEGWKFIGYASGKWLGYSAVMATELSPSAVRLLRYRYTFDAAVDYLTVTFPHMQEEFLVVELEKVPENLNESRIAS